ncbi:MAG: bifunctional (p)ppGpp synthetase/guanosine-3',5'-bis(diphosphate) 3'-pyrophosphohydrolase [Bacteroidetes bacterium]|nr:MAG: bifunctional (p)ppGpp synthetase/guanosine-3',5'-bis(diphosphate) 3'-pyrophosphohydrolase [Bacteroidota bacterium]
MIAEAPQIDLIAERKEILKRYKQLLKNAKPLLKGDDAKIIKKAFAMSMDAHQDMRRKSGEPYIFHPIAVAQICVDEIGLGTTSIVAALLHDVVEDSHYKLKDIESLFGERVAKIIDGLTKISGVFEHGSSQQAENFRKMLLTLSYDVRVILVKLADRLHNMRTLDSMSSDKQLKIASETMFLYAPLAHRLGLYAIKSEMEDLFLKYTEPPEYRGIALKLKQTKAARNKFISDFIAPIEAEIKKSGFNITIKGRPKSIFSIYNKIKNQNTPFEKVYDLFAIRIIVHDLKTDEEKAACWKVYSIITDFYKPNPDRLRDWISTPRSNGYESLHTTIMSSLGQWVEVQIRTERMDDIAEKGYAAHWKYKEGDVSNAEAGLEQWLSRVREVLENNDAPALDFVDNFRANLFKEEIFIFTPKGELKPMPAGSTALDFAFEIHSQIGARCIGAKVNQKLVPLSYVLSNGDQVEILTSVKQKPSEDWLKFVFTSKSKGKIREALKDSLRTLADDGKEIVARKLKHAKIELTDEIQRKLMDFYGEKSAIELFSKVAKHQIDLSHMMDFDKPTFKEEQQPTITDKKDFVREISKIKGEKTDMLLIGEDMEKIDYNLASCCNPISGDNVFGFVTVSEGIKIHRTTCPNAIELMSKFGYRIIKARWTSQKELAFPAGIFIEGTDRVGIINDITIIISTELKVNMRSITVDSDDGIFTGKIIVYVNDTKHLDHLMEKLSNVNGILKVSRFDYGDK